MKNTFLPLRNYISLFLGRLYNNDKEMATRNELINFLKELDSVLQKLDIRLTELERSPDDSSIDYNTTSDENVVNNTINKIALLKNILLVQNPTDLVEVENIENDIKRTKTVSYSILERLDNIYKKSI